MTRFGLRRASLVKTWATVAVALVAGAPLSASDAPAPDELAAAFATPPPEARPWVYWWFEGGYGHPEGMARDVAAMQEKGIGGVMHMQTINAGGLPLPQEPRMLDADWQAWFGEMLRVGHRAGLSLSASILDGWSHGGWWVGKADGAKQLVYTETQIDGPAAVTEPLPQPLTRLEVYRDVAVVAFKERTPRPPVPLLVTASDVIGGYCGEENWPAEHAVDGDPATYWRTQKACTPEAPATIELRYAGPIRAVSAMVAGMPNAGPAAGELQASDDGKEFKTVCGFTMAPGAHERLNFEATTGTVFRLVIQRAHAGDLQLAEFQVLRSGDEPVLRRGIKWWDYKSANRAWWQWPPNPYEALEEEYTGDDASDLAAAEVLDVTSYLRPGGRLEWQAPPGRWTVLRFGWTPLAEPARMGSGGYEVDVLNVRGADLMMDSAAKPMRALSVQHAAGAPVIFHTDSWEIGAGGKGQQPTWTDDFADQFRKRRGYELRRYLPALARRVVDDRETTGRFLRDYRDTVADLLADYYGRLQQRAHELGGGINSESGYGSYPHPHMDGLKIFGRADRPMAEFWHPFGQYRAEYLQWVDIMRTTASGARIYGNRFVQAETLTYNPTAGLFTPPSQYRRTLHEAWARGLNQAVIHKYTHQPFETPPGMLDYDIFNRHFSWWPLADGFLGYMGRCQAFLQQGDFVADAAYFVGEGASRFVPGREFLRPLLPPGYDYDGINAEILLTRLSVEQGMLRLPACKAAPGVQSGNGLRYRYLILSEPQCRTLSPAVFERIRGLVEAGATLVGPPPQAAPGLADRAAADARIKALAHELWGAAPGDRGERKVGQGRVLWGRSLEEIMTADGVKPDFEWSADVRRPTRAGLADASWIWHAADGGNPPPGERLFRTTLDIPEGRKPVVAQASMTADNEFVLLVNGDEVARGDNFHRVYDADISPSLLRAGRNEVVVRVTNGGDDRNPAGLIGKLVVTLDQGEPLERRTDAATWQSRAGDAPWVAARVVGPLGCSPWGSIETGTPTRAELAWIHRRTGDADIYFLANSLNQPLDYTVTVRAQAPVVQLFDPLDGTVRDLPERRVTADGRTTLALHFEPEQAFFLVLRRGSSKPGGGRNIVEPKPVSTIEGPWRVSFDARWVKPRPTGAERDATDVTVTFPRLEDWRRRAEAGIQAYSGVATYRTSFDLPAGTPGQPKFLEVGIVREMARVSINGRDLGVTWCPPWRVRIPEGLLKERGNALELAVANSWHNRLVADHALPEAERLTRVGHNLHQSAAQRGLQAAGLLGPVRLLAGE